MYGLKIPKYEGNMGTVTKRKTTIGYETVNIPHITKRETKLYIAATVSEEVTHGLLKCMNNMTSDIARNARRGCNATRGTWT